MSNGKTGLVLNGGGTKGIAQLGAVKRLNEIGYHFDAIVGSSIGSLNAVLAYTGQMDKALKLYKNINLSSVVPNNNLEQNRNIFYHGNILPLVKGFAVNKGYSTDNLLAFLYEHLYEFDLDNTEPFKDTEIGIMALQVKPRIKPVEIYLNGKSLDECIPYLVASMCFPIFKPMYINGSYYVDGGLYDVRPIHMLCDRGFENVLSLEVGGIGRKKCLKEISKYSNITIMELNPNIGLFEFNPDKMQRTFDKGYNAVKSFIG